MGFEAKGTDDIALARIVTLVPSEGKEPSHRLPYLVMGDQRRGGRGLHLDGRAGVDAGPVTVKGDSVTKDGSTYDWLFTSFPLDRAKVVRWGGGRGLWSYRVGDTEALVTVHPSEGRSEMVPRKGDAVKFRFELFTGPEFKDGLPGATFRPTAEFVARSDQV